MEKIIIPIELQLTPHSQAVMDALYKAIPTQFKAEDAHPKTASERLRHGEFYAGVVLDENGNHLHHLALLVDGQHKENINWQDAMDWAKSLGRDLPTRQEQSLLFANCKKHLPLTLHWSSETYKDDASYAWCCYFRDGYQTSHHKSYEGSAVAVRRF